MAGKDMTDFLHLIEEQLQPQNVADLKYVLKHSFTEDQLAELETGEDVAIFLKKDNLLEDNLFRENFKEILQMIGRNDLARNFKIYLAAGSHITTFEDCGYTFVCHMRHEDRKVLRQNVVSIPRDNEREIEIYGGAGELGKIVLKVAQWKNKCKSYFNRYFKTASIILVPSNSDTIMDTLGFLCSDSKSRGFVFKNYDIAKHLEFLGYDKSSLIAKLGKLEGTQMSKNISYIAYVEQKNAIFICEKVDKGTDIHQCLKNIATMVKYFLTLYNMEIQGSGVTIVGLLITEDEKQGKLVKCSFCRLFSPSYKDFESLTTFKDVWSSISSYEGWWDLSNPKKQNKLFNDLAAEILCFMAPYEKSLPALTDDKSQQFKQTYLLFTRQQMNIHFSDAKHVIIQGSYGSGKSMLGLKKLELILENCRQDEKIVYINFDSQSKLHYLMEKNVKEYLQIPKRKIKRINRIPNILKSPDRLIYLCRNRLGENLSVILQQTVRLNMGLSANDKTLYHLIIEEFDGETLTRDEAAKVTKLVKDSGLMESNIILLAQPLVRYRSWSMSNESYERETGMFHELRKVFKIVKTEEVFQCSNEICEITKFAQNFVRDKEIVFNAKMDQFPFKQQQQPEGNENHIVAPRVLGLNYSDVRTAATKSETSANEKGIGNADEITYHVMDLDQAFKRSAQLQNINAAGNKIVNKFDFLCEPRQGVDIKGKKPNLVEFSDIDLSSDVLVISLALVLKRSMGKSKTLTVLHMADEQPKVLTLAIQLLEKLDESFSYLHDIEAYFHKKKQSRIIFCSSFRSVNGMEFDLVVTVVNQSEYYLTYWMPLVISRCAHDLTFVLLPKDELRIENGSLHEPANVSSRPRNDKVKETVGSMMEELKRECLLKQVVVAECKACEHNSDCSSISNETKNKETFLVHTHSDKYKEYFCLLPDHAQLGKQAHGTTGSALACTKLCKEDSYGPTYQLSSNEGRTLRLRDSGWIASGSFGTVFLSIDQDTGEKIAKKCVEAGVDPSISKSVEQEIKFCTTLKHKRIVRYYGVLNDGKFIHIFMEYMEGGSIYDLIKNGALTEREVSRFCRQILEGLVYLHNKRIIHRDIKGANILLDSKFVNCKLADFGASKGLQNIRSTSGAKSLRGTVYWMSPEVVREEDYGWKTDIWSFGCTVLEMLTTKPPWSEFNEFAAFYQIGKNPITPHFPPGTSSHCLEFVQDCLQQNPRSRPAAADLLQYEFLQI